MEDGRNGETNGERRERGGREERGGSVEGGRREEGEGREGEERRERGDRRIYRRRKGRKEVEQNERPWHVCVHLHVWLSYRMCAHVVV